MSWWVAYHEYMDSAAWQKVRRAILERAGGKCERDGCTNAPVHVHGVTDHITT